MPHTASTPWLIKAVDIDGDKAKDVVIVDTEGDHPIHIRFATDEKKLGPEQRFALDMPHAIAFGQMDGKGGSEILVLEGQSGRARVLSLDQSAADETNKRGRLAFFALPQGNERGRSTGRRRLERRQAQGRDRHRSGQCAGLGLSPDRAFGALARARPFPAWAMHAPSAFCKASDGKAEVYVLSEQEKQIGRSTFENGRLSFPAPLALEGDPVAMDVADLDGDKTPEIVYVAKSSAPEARHGRRFVRAAGGLARAGRRDEVEAVGAGCVGASSPGVTAVPAAIKTVDINQDGRSDLLIFKDYGAPILVLSQKDGPPRLFTASLGPLSTAAAGGREHHESGRAGDARGAEHVRAPRAARRRRTLEDQGSIQRRSKLGAGFWEPPRSTPTATAPRRSSCSTSRRARCLFLSNKNGVYRPSGTLSVGSINFAGMHVADLDSDGRDDLLIAGTDRFGVLQTGRHGPAIEVDRHLRIQAHRGQAGRPRRR